ncbi:IPT/TIG domain-containing protein [Entamoeba marina]
MQDNTLVDYHFISRKRSNLSLPKHDYSDLLTTNRNAFRLIDVQLNQNITKALNKIIENQGVPAKSDWGFSLQTCENCGGNVFGNVTCCSCDICVCSKCRKTETIENGKYNVTFCLMCDSAYNKMLHSKQFETNLEEGQDTQIVSIHMKVTKTLLLFDETFRGLKAFQGVEGLGDESFLKDCKERLREFQIVLQKVTSLRQSIESYIPKSKTEERVLNTLYSVYASYNKEIIVKAITFASEFEEQITKEDVRIKQLKEQNKKLSIKSISNTVFPIDGGVLKLKLDCPDPEMKVFVNDVKQVATLNKQTLLIQIPKKRGDSDRITIQLESKYGSVSLTDIIFYDGSSKTNTIKSNQHKIPTDHIIYSTSTEEFTRNYRKLD